MRKRDEDPPPISPYRAEMIAAGLIRPAEKKRRTTLRRIHLIRKAAKTEGRSLTTEEFTALASLQRRVVTPLYVTPQHGGAWRQING